MVVRYHHDDIGINSRLDSIQAAILRVKLKHLSQFNSSRRAVADLYDKAFTGCPSLSVPERVKLFFPYISSIYYEGEKR
jgi:UDP-2-acetamido-2-deoxy-ribo-hexuluronate aminotransferase